jgi:tripartite-type tricarboxylate transporter receptor subunit TctC
MHTTILKRRFATLFALFIALGAITSSAMAQTYPTKPIRLVVGFPPGGGVDIVARLISAPLSERLGKQVVVENLSGAGGNIAATNVARAKPDGYTLLISADSSLAISASLYHNLSYKLLTDLTGVGVVASVPNVLVVNPSVPAKSVKDLIALAKVEPGKLNFGSAGSGTTVHLAGELFKSMTGINMTHIPYKGAAPAMTDLLGGRVQLMFDFLSASAPQIKAGKLRALAVTSSTRSPFLPDVPTVAEAGVPGYEVLGYFGIFAPAGTPAAVIDRLNHELSAVVNQPQVKKRFAEQWLTPAAKSPTEFNDTLKQEVTKWAKIVKATGLALN